MAFWVSYSYRKPDYPDKWYRSAAIDSSPYGDWVQMRCPKNAVFQHTNFKDYKNMCGVQYVYTPSIEVLHIECGFSSSQMRAKLCVSVNSAAKYIHVKSVDCRFTENWFKTTKYGGYELLRESIKFYASHGICILQKFTHDKIAVEFFGVGWEFVFIDSIQHDGTEWNGGCNFVRGPNDKTIAYFDPEQDIAATKIQAAFRGWKVRMQYRYNPHNCLGKYVILKSGGF